MPISGPVNNGGKSSETHFCGETFVCLGGCRYIDQWSRRIAHRRDEQRRAAFEVRANLFARDSRKGGVEMDCRTERLFFRRILASVEFLLAPSRTRLRWFALFATALLHAETSFGQQQLSSGGVRPFVIGVVPVIGPNGAVGGVSIDADGILDRVDEDVSLRLQANRRQALQDGLQPVSADMNRPSASRKISLRRLEALIVDCRTAGKPLPQHALYFAGLQRVQHVFIYPDIQDVVLAGYAEGWHVDHRGEVVGLTTGQPVLKLDDLIVALRSADDAGSGSGISCSIDPSEEGLRRFQQVASRSNLQMSRLAIARLEHALGASKITVTGVDAQSHFAHTLVAADFLMKRLAMGFEKAPVADLPSYLELVQASPRPPKDLMFRLWMAPCYDRVLRDPRGLAWEFDGSGVQTLTENEWLTGNDANVGAAQIDPTAKKWAQQFTTAFPQLAERMTVFAELRNCIDLAVVGAILSSQRSARRSGYPMSLWMDEKESSVPEYRIPKVTPARASFIRRGREWIVSVSGGVDVDSWSVVESAQVQPALATVHAAAAPGKNAAWWWD